MNRFELVFFPVIGAGHLASAVELANVLVSRDPRLCVTILIFNLPSSDQTKSTKQIQSLSADFSDKAINFVVLPQQPPPEGTYTNFLLYVSDIIDSYKPSVAEAVAKLKHPLIGFVLDLFCASIIDVANQFHVPCYLYNTCNAGFLSILLSLQQIYDGSDGDWDFMKQSELALPGFLNPVPSTVVPTDIRSYETRDWLYNIARKIRFEFKGVLNNTFFEMEPHILNSMSNDSVSLFSVGPILHLNNSPAGGSHDDGADILRWLDHQPRSSVVFLCFGSMGSFGKEQVWEIAHGLEHSGVRFVWSLRKKPPPEMGFMPTEYVDIGEDLPNGFLDRTAGMGKVIGWAPQVKILGHSAIGGFVSHCGWNSTLESVWHSVPMITWPLFGEQDLNAFEMSVELGLAVDMVNNDYNHVSNPRLIRADEIESGIRRLMEDNGEIRKKVEAKSEESRASVMEGGSSFISLGRFIDELFTNTQRRD